MLLEDNNFPRKRGYEPHPIGFSDMRPQDSSKRGYESRRRLECASMAHRRKTAPIGSAAGNRLAQNWTGGRFCMNARDSLRMPMQSDVASGSVRRVEDDCFAGLRNGGFRRGIGYGRVPEVGAGDRSDAGPARIRRCCALRQIGSSRRGDCARGETTRSEWR